MKVKTTNQMVSFIKKNIKIKEIDRVYLKKVNYPVYKWITPLDSNENLDYDTTTGLLKVIAVEYNPNCYACSRYLTTSELLEIFKKSNKTAESFIAELKSNLEI